MWTNTPWDGLEPGKVDGRRVSAKGKWNFFWTVMPGPDPGLVMQVSALPRDNLELPKLRNLEVALHALNGTPVLYLRLRDPSQVELFHALCIDIVAASELSDEEPDALLRAIQRTHKWHHLLQGGKLETLPEEGQKGLIGELQVLNLLLDNLKPSAALGAWTGPHGAPKDFELAAHCIEVKARRGASQPFVTISNEFQLADVAGCYVWLAVLAVDKVEDGVGRTLTFFVDDVRARVAAAQISALAELDRKLDAVGYDSLHDYGRWSWKVGPLAFHAVVANFPRISAPVKTGVSRVSYSLSLEACAPFVVDTTIVTSSLFKGA